MQARVQYRTWQFLTAVARRVPQRLAYALASLIGTLGFYCWPRGRRATLRNYKQVMDGASPSEVRRVARASMVNYCHYLADFIRFPSFEPHDLNASVHGHEAFEALDRALERGKGAVIVLMHFGNWDLAAGAAVARGYPVTVVAETFADARLDQMVVDSRRRMGVQVVKMERPGPSLVKALRRNGLLALLIDRPVPGDGVKVRFFGEEVEVPAGPARLALRTGATVVPTACLRLERRGHEVTTLADFTISFEPSGDEEADIAGLTQAIMDVHEEYIRRYPEQWYMFREMWPSRRAQAAVPA
ncbi:MAG TPA: lysophospholipid acyltransferase family protein [Tepidiformaceae bacterium]|nr:lysophospholipid acyltransferase family protein [Tepidiformaceae bacterium]